MKFQENNNIISVNSFFFRPLVYFILKNNDVIYVGQSKYGAKRAFEHFDMDFDSIGFVECELNQLNFCEDFYIAKYLPIHNKRFNGSLYKKCIKGIKYKNTVVLNGVSYYYHKRDNTIKFNLYNSIKQNYIFTNLIEPILYRNNKSLKFLASILGLTELHLLESIDSNSLNTVQLERMARCFDADLDIRFISRETGKPII